MLLIVFRGAGLDLLSGLERRLYDGVLLPLLPPPPTSDQVVIVAIDDRSLVEGAQRWPLSRSTWATFIKRMSAAGPSAITLDLVFDQDSQSELLELAERVRAQVARIGLPNSEVVSRVLEVIDDTAAELDADLSLTRALAQAGHVTLGVILSDRPSALTTPLVPDPLALEPDEVSELAVALGTLVSSTPRLFYAARGHGAMNVILDPDGVVRRYPYIVGYDGRALSSLALATRVGDLRATESSPLIQRTFEADRAAPLIRFRADDTPFPVIDVLSADTADLARLVRGKAVFVGSTASGVEDLLRAPHRVRMPGVEAHATAFENLLLGTWLESEGPALLVGAFSTLALVGGFAILLGRRLRARTLWLAGVGFWGLHFVVAVLVVALGLVVARDGNEGQAAHVIHLYAQVQRLQQRIDARRAGG
ncbi:MAG TPA: CHASE2 domain-containing protein, partial [Myxococcota bacterium]|nr:CHASE2 domain-containing protein [Myxococcota bacterium]